MARQGICTVCGSAFTWFKVKGPLPARCKPCRLARDAERARVWRTANPERARAIYKRNNDKRLADPEFLRKKREDATRRMYGLEPEELDALIEKQQGRCAICLGPPNGPGSRLHVDHCHDSSRVRGLLCGKCNTMLGLATDNAETLEAAIRYLREA